jgi:Domain of unknown function (DUF4260)
MHAAQIQISRTTARRSAYAALTALLLAGAIAEILRDGTGVWQLFAFGAAPDLALLVGIGPGLEKGRLHPRAVPFYNAAHSFWGPAVLAVAAIALPAAWLVGALGWALHIALDRSVGYGMRTRDGFQRS